jgi:hypothetical protein
LNGVGGNGWSTNAAIGTQGAQFSGSTFGYYRIKVSFDVYLDTANAEANLQVQYSTDGSTWNNATIASAGTGVGISNNVSSPNTVKGSYVKLANGWNTNITADLSGLSGVDSDANFAIRLVNASTGPDCVDTTGNVYANTNGSWTFDNVMIRGTSIDTIVEWTFESYPAGPTIVTNPVPEIGGASLGKALSLGFNNNYVYAGNNGTGSVDASDIPNNQGTSSSGPSGVNIWRVRGAIPATGVAGIGWNSQAPIGTQGAQFDVNTTGYSNIVCSFDVSFSGAAEAKLCVLYTTDGWAHTNVANSLFYGTTPSYILTNSTSSKTVSGTYFFETAGQNFYNNICVDFTGNHNVENNPLFGFKVVNAATDTDCVNNGNTAYNNSSGNWRYDNVTIGGTAGTPPPTISLDPNATVDAPFTNTFTDDPAWRANLAAVLVDGLSLTNTAYSATTPGKIIFTPANSTLLQSSGLHNIVFIAPGFGTARVSQPLAAGVTTHLSITTQVKAPTASGGTLVANPVLGILDQYGNGTTNPYAGVTVTATVGGTGAWVLGGDTNQPFLNGFATFTNLNATASAGSVSNYITFVLTGYAPLAATNSAFFNIGPAPVAFTPGNLAILQLDKSANNTTISVIEIKPSTAGQTTPVNIVPISATGTNGLRMANSGTCSRLSLSDDGTLVCFGAFLDDSSATPDETFNLNRAAAGMDYSGNVNIGLRYVSPSLGGSQARSCVFLGDNTSAPGDWILDDKAGLYQGNTNNVPDAPNLNPYNNVVVKTFGGVPYVLTQKVTGPSLPGFYHLAFDPDTDLYDGTPFVPGVPIDANAQDFYMISTNGGATYDVLYMLTTISTNAIIKKYSLVSGAWTANGVYTNRVGGSGADSLFATTNGTGRVYLYMTTAPSGSSANNSVVRLTDAAGWNQTISIISSNVVYTASGNTYVRGLTFVPQQVTNTPELMPPPILTAQTFAATNATFTITNTPDDGVWRSNLTLITVNGSVLARAAYSTNQVGKIVFDPSQDPLLQNPGAKVIVFSATGYSTNSITQVVAGVAAKLAVSTQPTAPAADGAVLAAQPKVVVQDTFGNPVSSTATITAAPAQSNWLLGGTTNKAAVAGTASFTGLTAFNNSAFSGATIAFTSSGLTSVTSSPAFTIPAPVQSVLGGVNLTGGKLTFSFTNATGLGYTVLATNNIAAPVTNWPVIGTAVESPASSGNYSFTNSSPATNGAVYYILRQP